MIAPDLLGHGMASRSDTYQIDDLVANVLPRVAGKEFDLLMGHSLGGPVSLGVYPHLRNKPQRFVLVDPAFEINDTKMEMVKETSLNDIRSRPSAKQFAQQRPNWTENATIVKSLQACLASTDAIEYIGTVW